MFQDLEKRTSKGENYCFKGIYSIRGIDFCIPDKLHQIQMLLWTNFLLINVSLLHWPVKYFLSKLKYNFLPSESFEVEWALGNET